MDSDRSKVVQWPHAEGIVRLAFSPDGQYLYTSGSEGYMRVFDARIEADSPFEAKLIEYHDEPVTAITASAEFLCSGSESGVVSLHRAAGAGTANELESLVTRCSFPVRSVRFDPKGKRLAVASDELIVKVVDAQDPLKIQLLAGHKKAVREASWSPDGKLIATSSADGSIMLWQLNAGSEPTCIKTIENLIRAADPESEYSVEAVWHPTGKYFVVGTKNNEIAIISRDTWAKTGTFTASDGHTSEISALAFSANGNYLASSAKDGNVLIWSTSTRSIVNRTTNPAPGGLITALAFHPAPGANALAYADYAGQLVRWEGPVPANLPGPGQEPSRARSESVARSVNAGDEYDDEFDTLDDFVVDDTGLGEYNDLDVTRPARAGRASSVAAYAPPSRGQEPFQPGATPFRGGRRYLAFNMLGLIQVVERDEQNLVTVEFHDRSAHAGSHFTDNFKFSIAALGELGSVYGCRDSGVNPSVVHYRPYDSWANLHEWDYNLPRGENATVLALGGVASPDDRDAVGIAGSGTVLVATSAGYVRFLTGAGIQKYVWNLGEEVVTMAAARDWALIVHRAPSAGPGLAYSLIDTDTFEVVQQGSIPLTRNTTLAWVGFTDEHIPAMFDSNGVLSLLDRARRPRQARWVPALDSRQLARREGKQESYWPVGVSSQHLHALILKGADRFPGFPTPLIQELELQFPLLQLEVEQAQLEEKYLRESFFTAYRRDGAPPEEYALRSQLAKQELETDKHILKLIQTFCKAEKLEAALDAALLLSQQGSLVAAGKLAAYYKLPALEDRIQIVKEHKAAEQEGLKRDAKWIHKTDDRIYTSEPAQQQDPRPTGPGFFNKRPTSSVPPSSYARLPPSSTASYSTQGPPTHPRRQQHAAEVDEMDITMDDTAEGEEDTYDEREALEADEESQAVVTDQDDDDDTQDTYDMPPPPAPAVRKGINPFAKKAAPTKPAAPAPNAFASKKATKAKDLSAKGSFFGRVEGTEPAKAKPAPKPTKSPAATASGKAANGDGVTSASRDGTLQTFLFGKAPNASADEARKNKRKSIAVEDIEAEAEGEFRQAKHSRAQEVRELPREGEEFEDTQESSTDTQSDSYASLAAKRSVAAVEEEQEEEESEDTQMSATQRDEDEDDNSQLEKENSRPALNGRASSGDGISKLAQFRNATRA